MPDWGRFEIEVPDVRHLIQMLYLFWQPCHSNCSFWPPGVVGDSNGEEAGVAKTEPPGSSSKGVPGADPVPELEMEFFEVNLYRGFNYSHIYRHVSVSIKWLFF